MRQRTTSTKFKHRSSVYAARQSADSIHWLFRTNIPRRRNQSFSSNIHKRNFFGMGDIIGVLTNVSNSFTSSRMCADGSSSLQRQYGLSPNRSNSLKTPVEKLEKTTSDPSFAPNTHFLAYRDSFHDTLKRRPSNAR